MMHALRHAYTVAAGSRSSKTPKPPENTPNADRRRRKHFFQIHKFSPVSLEITPRNDSVSCALCSSRTGRNIERLRVKAQAPTRGHSRSRCRNLPQPSRKSMVCLHGGKVKGLLDRKCRVGKQRFPSHLTISLPLLVSRDDHRGSDDSLPPPHVRHCFTR